MRNPKTLGNRWRAMALCLMSALCLADVLPAAGGAGMPAPPAGAPIDLSAWQGSVVYVDFWASWCVPCRQSFPWMNAMLRQYGPDSHSPAGTGRGPPGGLVIVAVNMDQTPADAEAFLREHPADFMVRFDPRGDLARRFHVRGMPTSALLDRNGRVLLQHEGFRIKDTAALEQAIRDALLHPSVP